VNLWVHGEPEARRLFWKALGDWSLGTPGGVRLNHLPAGVQDGKCPQALESVRAHVPCIVFSELMSCSQCGAEHSSEIGCSQLIEVCANPNEAHATPPKLKTALRPLLDEDSLVGEVLGAYRLTRKLGVGGLCAVYLGESADAAPVAVKILHKPLVGKALYEGQVRAEAVALRRVSHPNVIRLLTEGHLRGRPALVLEYCAGTVLSARLKGGAQIESVEAALHLLAELAKAVSASHAAGVLHRDIKPANILVEATEGRDAIKLIDFGAVELPGVLPPSPKGRFIFGTPAYMAPEQLLGKDVDERVDLFALGVLGYRMLTGKLPFPGGDDLAGLVRAHQTLRPVRPQVLNPRVERAEGDLLMRLLSQDPSARCPTAEHVSYALKSLIDRRRQVSRARQVCSKQVWPSLFAPVGL
jgi:serine/threonine protein kinase